MKRLWLASIPDDFDPEKDIPLGPWCFLGKEHLFPEWENIEFEPDPFKSANEMAHHSQLTVDFANNYIIKLTDKLNDINRTDYSIKFWQIMTYPWLLTLVQTTWERQLRVRQFVEKYLEVPLEINLLQNNIPWNFKDTIDHQKNGVLSPLYNEWLYSKLFVQAVPPKWKISWRQKQKKKKTKSSNNLSFKRKFIEWYSYNVPSSTV